MNFALNVIARGSIVLAAAALACIPLRRASAAARHAVWVLAIASTLLLPLAVVLLPQLQLPLLPQARATTQLIPATIHLSTIVAGRPVENSTGYFTPEFLLVLWTFGLALMLTRFLAGMLGIRRLAKAARVPEDQSWESIVAQLLNPLGLRESPRLLFSAREVSPMTWGFRRKTILLPASAQDWPEQRRRVVLAHELAHVKRGDALVQILAQFASSLYWFNPLIWYAAGRERVERERACDDQVLSLGGAPEDYADHLVQVVRGLQRRKPLSFAAVTMAQPSQLEARLVSILDSRVRRRAISKPRMLLLCAVAGMAMLFISGISLTTAVPLPPVMATMAKLTPPSETETAPAPPQRTHIGDNPIGPNSTVVPPQVIATTGPLYAAIEGTVTLEASVDVEGNARILRVVKGLNPDLDARAVEAVMNWKFAPALKDGMAVSAVTQIDVDFKLPPEPQPLRVGGDVRPPVVIRRVEPQYSEQAREARAQGTVVLEAIVRKDGSVDIVRVVHSIGYGLDVSAIEALKQWVFKPGTKNGDPVDIAINIEVNFNLRDGPAAGPGPVPPQEDRSRFNLKIDRPE
jgi:TonB family protein